MFGESSSWLLDASLSSARSEDVVGTSSAEITVLSGRQGRSAGGLRSDRQRPKKKTQVLAPALQDRRQRRRQAPNARFARPVGPHRGTHVHPPGSHPGGWDPDPSSGHPARHAGTPSPGQRHPPGRSRPPTGHPKARRTATAPRGHRRSRTPPPIEPKPAAPFPRSVTQGAADPCAHRDPGRRRPPTGGRGCPKGGSRGRPATQPRTVATERASTNTPTVPALDLTSATAPSRHGVKARPRRTPPPLRCRG